MTRRWIVNLLSVVVVAVVAYIAVLGGTPYLIMGRTMKGVANRAGGYNTALSGGQLPTSASRGVVRPSPDLLYTACAFDVSGGPVLIAGAPSDAYWSVALYAANTDNFYVLDDRQAAGKPVAIVLVSQDRLQSIPADYKTARIVEPPSKRGIVLFRYLVLDSQELEAARAAQRTAVCRKL